MKSIPISEFKAKCAAVLKEVNDTNETVLVTRHGRPFAEIPAATEATSRTSSGAFAEPSGSAVIS